MGFFQLNTSNCNLAIWLFLQCKEYNGSYTDSNGTTWYCPELNDTFCYAGKGDSKLTVTNNSVFCDEQPDYVNDVYYYSLSEPGSFTVKHAGIVFGARQREWTLPNGVTLKVCSNAVKSEKCDYVDGVVLHSIYCTKNGKDVVSHVLSTKDNLYCITEVGVRLFESLYHPVIRSEDVTTLLGSEYTELCQKFNYAEGSSSMLREFAYVLYMSEKSAFESMVYDVYGSDVTYLPYDFNAANPYFSIEYKGISVDFDMHLTLSPIEAPLYKKLIHKLLELKKDSYASADNTYFEKAVMILKESNIKIIHNAYNTNEGSFTLDVLKQIKSILCWYNTKSNIGFALLSANENLDFIIGSNASKLAMGSLFNSQQINSDTAESFTNFEQAVIQLYIKDGLTETQAAHLARLITATPEMHKYLK